MEDNEKQERNSRKILVAELSNPLEKRENKSSEKISRRRSSYFRRSIDKRSSKGADGLERHERRLKSIQLFSYNHLKLIETAKNEGGEKETTMNILSAKRRESRLLSKKDKPASLNINLFIKKKDKTDVSPVLIQRKREFDEIMAEKFFESFERHFLFSCVPPQQLRIIQSQLVCFEIKNGDYIFRKKDLSKECFLIEKGYFRNDLPIVVKEKETSLEKKQAENQQEKKGDNPRHLRSPPKQKFENGPFNFTLSEKFNFTTPEFCENITSIGSIPLEKSEKELLDDNALIQRPLTNFEKEKVDMMMLRRCSISSKNIPIEKEVKNAHKSSYSDSFEERSAEVKMLGIGSGEFLGDMSLFLNSERLSDVIASEDSVIWSAGIALFEKVIKEGSYFHFSENLSFLLQSPFFSSLPKSSLENISTGIINLKFFKGETISVLNKKKCSSFLFIVREGMITLRRGKVSKQLRVGDFFYEESLLNVPVKYSTLVISDQAILLALPPSNLRKSLPEDILQTMYFFNLKQLLLKQSSLFRFVSDKFIERIAESMPVTGFEKGKKLRSERFRNRLMLLISGEIQTIDGKEYHRGPDIIGKQSLYEKKFSSVQPEFIATKEGYFSDLTYEEFRQLVEKKSPSKNGMEVTPQKAKILEGAMQDWSQSPIHLSSKKIDRSLIRLIREIGEGKFGVVYLVTYENKQFALKIITKINVVEYSAEKLLQNEKKILERLEFPFFNRLYGTFKDDHCIYFLLEYIKGCNLFSILCSCEGKLEYDVVRFYAACIVLALQYIHQKGIIHRDLKPENIMIDEIGYPKIVDFGVAKNLNEDSSIGSVFSFDSYGNDCVVTDEFFNPKLRTYTLVGTPHYMAPEVIQGRGYSSSIDYWSLGVVIFELLYGYLPYDSEEQSEGNPDPYEIYKIILTRKLKIPKVKKELRARKFIKKLLKKDPLERVNSNEDLKKSKWFENVVWEKILFREFKAPLLPIIEEENESHLDISLDQLLSSQEMREFRKYSFENRGNEIAGWDDVF